MGCHKSPKEPKFLGPGRKKLLLPTFEMPEEVAPKQRLAQEVPEGRWGRDGGWAVLHSQRARRPEQGPFAG